MVSLSLCVHWQLQWSATVDFFVCVFCPLVAQVRALLCFLIVRWMRSIAPSVQSNIASSAYCVFPGFLFVAIPPLHSLSLLIYGPWWVPAVARRCLDVLLLFLQVSFLFGGGSGAVIYSPDGWPFVWDGAIWGPQQVCVSVWVSFLYVFIVMSPVLLCCIFTSLAFLLPPRVWRYCQGI